MRTPQAGAFKICEGDVATVLPRDRTGDKVMCRNVWRFTDTASGKKMQFRGLRPLAL
jgi:hypothetical protein